MKKGEGVSTFTGQQDLTFEGNAAALGTCPVTVTGTVEDGNADMTINVKVPTLQQTVKVTYSGVKQVQSLVEINSCSPQITQIIYIDSL